MKLLSLVKSVYQRIIDNNLQIMTSIMSCHALANLTSFFPQVSDFARMRNECETFRFASHIFKKE